MWPMWECGRRGRECRLNCCRGRAHTALLRRRRLRLCGCSLQRFSRAVGRLLIGLAFGFLLTSRPRPEAGTAVAELRRGLGAGLPDFLDDGVGHGF